MMPHRSAFGLPHRVAMPQPVIRVLPGAPESAAAARRVTRELLGDGHPAADTAMLVVSELVTNSVKHSQSCRPGGTVTVAVCSGQTSVLIQVRDDGGPCEPRVAAAEGAASDGGDTPAADGEHGYGLLLVDALAETWGTIATADGRLTWCRLALSRLSDGADSRLDWSSSSPGVVSEDSAEVSGGADEDQLYSENDQVSPDYEPRGSVRDSER